MQAEVCYFAEQIPESLTLQKVMDASTLTKVSRLANHELPIRFAQRILQIEQLPEWRKYEDIVAVHRLYTETFRDLRLVELGDEGAASFTELVRELKKRMQSVIPRLATGMRSVKLDAGFPDADIDRWLDEFLLSRIGTEMLTSQHMACATAAAKAAEEGAEEITAEFTGIVDNNCDPAKVCEQAALHARRLCKQHYKIRKDVRIIVESAVPKDGGRVKFPYVPQYLFYIMVELLKNSCRATVELLMARKELNKLSERPIVITVGADEQQVAIRLHDQAGGIPFDVHERVWSYMYSTASNQAENYSLQQGTPLAGYGVGLPLSRLYARYLGGSLHLQPLPGVGTSAYLYLKRVQGEAREEHPVSFASFSSLSSATSLSSLTSVNDLL